MANYAVPAAGMGSVKKTAQPPQGGGGTKPPTTGQIWPRGNKTQ